MKFKADLKKLYEAGIHRLKHGGTIDSCTYDVVNSLGGVILQNGETIEVIEQKYAGGFMVKPENRPSIVFSRREFRILTKNVLEEYEWKKLVNQ